uniref:F5/8 type C domain-containing protein n=1 Tax=Anguilla anguilla TaxID=7936 RepID=A0A0E9QUW2_ANGAN
MWMVATQAAPNWL